MRIATNRAGFMALLSHTRNRRKNNYELKFVHFDCCFTGRLKITGNNQLVEGPEGSQGLLANYHNDMSLALSMQSGQTQIYQGWWGEVSKAGTSKFNIFAYHEWDKLGEGDNLYEALMYANSETDIISDGPHDNLRLMGQGDLTACIITSLINAFKGWEGAVYSAIVFGIILALEKAITVYDSNKFINEYIPLEKNISV